jgi:hypothetical protein
MKCETKSVILCVQVAASASEKANAARDIETRQTLDLIYRHRIRLNSIWAVISVKRIA